MRATDCALIVTDAEGADLLRGGSLDLGVDDDNILVIGTALRSLLRIFGSPTATEAAGRT
jgi:hypothetical protein